MGASILGAVSIINYIHTNRTRMTNFSNQVGRLDKLVRRDTRLGRGL